MDGTLQGRKGALVGVFRLSKKDWIIPPLYKKINKESDYFFALSDSETTVFNNDGVLAFKLKGSYPNPKPVYLSLIHIQMCIRDSPNGYIFTWLIAYSSLLGPVGGIMIADYYFIRKQQLNVTELYQHKGQYGFKNGFNSAAIIALLA